MLRKNVSDDFDLEALMTRVREAATASVASGASSAAPPASEASPGDLDLVRVIDAQGEWNEQTTRSIAAVVECLRHVRDDWVDAHARLAQEVARLSTAVELMRTPRGATTLNRQEPAAAVARRRSAKATKRGRRRS